MKNRLFAALLFLFSCNSNNKTETPGEIKKNDFSFQGLSIFKKGSTIRDIETKLDSIKIKHFIVSGDNKYLNEFGLPFECCTSKTIMYLPSYNFGDLYITDLFLLFKENKLALIRAEDNYNTYGSSRVLNPLEEFKMIFKEKFGNGEITNTNSNSGNTQVFKNKEVFENSSDTILMHFEEINEKDSIFSADGTIPFNKSVYLSNLNKWYFRNGFLKTKERAPIIKPGKDPWYPENGMYVVNAIYLSFEMTFPSKLEDCCNNIEDSFKMADSSYQKSRTKSILDAL